MLFVKRCMLFVMLLSAISLNAFSEIASPMQILLIDSGEVDGWIPETTIGPEKADKMMDLINGAAIRYVENGCVLFSEQRLKGEGTYYCDCFVTDFNSETGSKNMFLIMMDLARIVFQTL